MEQIPEYLCQFYQYSYHKGQKWCYGDQVTSLKAYQYNRSYNKQKNVSIEPILGLRSCYTRSMHVVVLRGEPGYARITL